MKSKPKLKPKSEPKKIAILPEEKIHFWDTEVSFLSRLWLINYDSFYLMFILPYWLTALYIIPTHSSECSLGDVLVQSENELETFSSSSFILFFAIKKSKILNSDFPSNFVFLRIEIFFINLFPLLSANHQDPLMSHFDESLECLVPMRHYSLKNEIVDPQLSTPWCHFEIFWYFWK